MPDQKQAPLARLLRPISDEEAKGLKLVTKKEIERALRQVPAVSEWPIPGRYL